MDLIDIFRTSHPTAEEHLFFKCTWNILQTDHILGHKSNLSIFKKIEIISNNFSDHSAMRQDINYKINNVKNTNTQRLNNTFLNNKQVTEEIKREIKQFLETNDNENTTAQNLWDAAKTVLKVKFSNTTLLQETRKTSTRQPNFTPITTGKRRIKEHQS